MRTALLAIALLFSVDATACPMADAAAYATAAAEVQGADGMKTAFTVAGLTCTSTSAQVADALKGVEGVLAAAVDYQTGEAVVAFDNAKTNPDALLAAISQTGYAAEKKQDS
ncbi:MAG: heavy metal-associated domain-containing protein [Myxococcota bacterium]|nr:heavy metal-associated domain-containing protein [Myxococcota bacterium]